LLYDVVVVLRKDKQKDELIELILILYRLKIQVAK